MKLVGLKPALRKLIEEMEQYFSIVPTSRFIDHDDDELTHIYLRVLGARQQ